MFIGFHLLLSGSQTFREEDEEPCAQIFELIGKCWGYNSVLFEWLQFIVKRNLSSSFIALRDLGARWKNESEVSTWIKNLAINSADRSIQKAAVLALTYPTGDKSDSELFIILKSLSPHSRTWTGKRYSVTEGIGHAEVKAWQSK